KWNISFGDRQSWDKKSHYFLPAGVLVPGYEAGKFKNNSLEVGTQYRFDETKMIYARYAQGYRGGGFVSNPGTLLAAARFEPETVDSYEIGIKTEWFNRRLRLNVSAFHNQYKDMQQSIIRPVQLPNGATSFFTVTQNAAKARTQGVEVETIIIPVR